MQRKSNYIPKPKTLPNRLTKETRLYLVLFLVAVFGGAIRKWFTESGLLSNLILLIQIILPFFFLVYKSNYALSPFAKFKVLGIYTAYLIYHIINPLQLTIMHGILGFIIYGALWFGMFYYFSNRHLFNFKPVLKILLFCSVFEIILAFIQYALPTTHFLNRYANMDIIENIALVGDRVRVTGTFSFLSGYNAFTVFYILFVWALKHFKFKTWLVIGLLVFGLVASFMTGSRSGTAIYLGFSFFLVFREYNIKELGRMIGALLIPAMLFIAVMQLYPELPVVQRSQEAYENFANRVLGLRAAGEETERLTWGLDFLNYWDRFEAPWTGIGLGATYQGAGILFGTSQHVYRFGYVEVEFLKIILEGGVAMLMFRVFLAGVLVYNFILKGPIKIFLWVCLMYAMPIVFNVHNATFLMLGLMILDNAIWRNQIALEHQKKEWLKVWRKNQMHGSEATVPEAT